jgi:hypothetical protein
MKIQKVIAFLGAAYQYLAAFFAVPRRRWWVAIGALACIAAIDLATTQTVRRSYVFVSAADGLPVVEQRFLPRSSKLQEAVGLYVAEFLLGPQTPRSSAWFARGSRLESCLVRDDTAYIDLNEAAAVPPPDVADLRPAVAALQAGIVRNFPAVKEVAIFIAGREPYAETPPISVEAVPEKN